VRDKLYHRIVVLDDGATRFALISTDNAGISPAFYDRVSVEISKQADIPKDNVWWCMTHTHHAPEVGDGGFPEIVLPHKWDHEHNPAYTRHVENQVVIGVVEAVERLQPARLGVGRGKAQVNINRREPQANGTVQLGENPNGPVDEQLGILRLE